MPCRQKFVFIFKMMVERPHGNIGGIGDLFDRNVIKSPLTEHCMRYIKYPVFCLYGLKLTFIAANIQRYNSLYEDTN